MILTRCPFTLCVSIWLIESGIPEEFGWSAITEHEAVNIQKKQINIFTLVWLPQLLLVQFFCLSGQLYDRIDLIKTLPLITGMTPKFGIATICPEQAYFIVSVGHLVCVICPPEYAYDVLSVRSRLVDHSPSKSIKVDAIYLSFKIKRSGSLKASGL